MIVKNIMRPLLINLIISGYLISQMPLKDFEDWNILQDTDIQIGYVEKKFPWCKASVDLPYKVDEILVVIENVNDYKKMLDSVIYSTKNDDDVAHIRINYPFPFTDREYIVKFVKILDENDIVYTFETNEELNKSIDPDYIRLINAKGEWRLSPISDNLTKVSYTWNGELRGDFPSWSLTKAWTKHGNEVLGNLRENLREFNED
tara:strand:+ start:149 stop:760 length:612 start_codon:yes stop_codon:yes gene_type:complete